MKPPFIKSVEIKCPPYKGTTVDNVHVSMAHTLLIGR